MTESGSTGAEGRVATGPLITLSASYGAGGSEIGPVLAQRLGLQFIDRAIPTAVAERLEIPLDEAIAHEERPESVLDRLLSRFAPIGPVYGAPVGMLDMVDDQGYARAAEQVINERARAGGCVILGRAAAVVLGDDPRALHVRLDGPEDKRIAQAMRMSGIDADTAHRLMRQTDRAREAYVHHFYGTDVEQTSLYHLMIDSTRIDFETCANIIVEAVRVAPASV